MAFFTIFVKLPGVPGALHVSDVHEEMPVAFVAEAIRARRGLGVSSFVHLGYERPVHGHSVPGPLEVVPLSHWTTVAQAYNLILKVSSFDCQLCTHLLK